MQYNPGDGSGCVDEINDLCSTDDTTYPLTSKTRRFNAAIDRFFTIVEKADKSWNFDDTNSYEADGTTLRKLPIASTNLASGKQDYKLAAEHLVVTGLWVMDDQGVFHQLKEETEPQNTVMQPSGNVGVPTKYKMRGNSILLDFIPNYSQTLGLRITFKRTGSKFLTTDTTKEPGIPVLFHPWLCQVAALPYLLEHGLPRKNDVASLIASGTQDILNFAGTRQQARTPRMSPAKEDNR